jgi:hypothetical protein
MLFFATWHLPGRRVYGLNPPKDAGLWEHVLNLYGSQLFDKEKQFCGGWKTGYGVRFSLDISSNFGLGWRIKSTETFLMDVVQDFECSYMSSTSTSSTTSSTDLSLSFFLCLLSVRVRVFSQPKLNATGFSITLIVYIINKSLWVNPYLYFLPNLISLYLPILFVFPANLCFAWWPDR